jgi:hypothetical protein
MKRSAKFLVAIATLETLSGLVVPDPRQAGAIGIAAFLFLSVAVPAAIYSWCQADISERAIPYPAGTPILVGGLPPIGLLIYFFRTRNALAAVAGVGKSVAFIALCLALSYAGAYIHLHYFV